VQIHKYRLGYRSCAGAGGPVYLSWGQNQVRDMCAWKFVHECSSFFLLGAAVLMFFFVLSSGLICVAVGIGPRAASDLVVVVVEFVAAALD